MGYENYLPMYYLIIKRQMTIKNNIKCDLCGKVYQRLQNLQQHILNTASNISACEKLSTQNERNAHWDGLDKSDDVSLISQRRHLHAGRGQNCYRCP